MRSPTTLAAILIALLALAAPASAVKTGDPATDEALPRLVCICGGCPKLTLDTCLCGRAEELAAEALALSREGRDADQIVAAFVDRYGPQILAAPPPRGFDLALWIGPPAVLVAGAFVLWLWLRRRRRRAAAAAPEEIQSTGSLLPDFDPFA